MKKIKVLLVAIILLITGSITTGCSEDDSIREPTGKLTLKLSDAPFHYDQFKEVNVTIDKIEIRRIMGNGDSEYIIIMNNPRKSNLLELVNGVTETIVEYDLPLGNYDLIRMFMSSSEMLMNNGESFYNDMDFGYISDNNRMHNGMKANNSTRSIDIPFDSFLTIMDGIHEEYLLDIDVSQSFMLEGVEYNNTGSGMMMNISGFSFNPVMRFVQMSTSGTIRGNVVSDNENMDNATVSIMQSGNVYTSTHTDENGNFVLIGIPEGNYTMNVIMDGYIMESSRNESVMGSFKMMPNSTLNMNFYMTEIE